MRKAIVGLAIALVSALAWALPTIQQVEAEVRQGNYAHAESMMNEVVTARPGSARAHYVYAEILAHNRNFAKAADEAQKARQIDPAITFTDPAKFKSFEQLLAREQSASTRSTATPTGSGSSMGLSPDRITTPREAPPAAAREPSGMPGWLWGIGLAALAWVAWRAFSRRRAAAAGGTMGAGAAPFGAQPGAPNAGPYNPGGPYNNPNAPHPGGYAPRSGSGMLGTGMAVAGGVAGGMLLDQMLHRNQQGNAAAPTAGNDGLVPGIFDTGDAGATANELQSRPVDFGSGDDWGGDAGSIDVGSGGSGDDWG
jgi:hypothetical protein